MKARSIEWDSCIIVILSYLEEMFSFGRMYSGHALGGVVSHVI